MALIWRRVLAVAIVAASISGIASSDAAAAERVARDLGVVTYNQYLGADLTPLLVAPAGQFNAALLGVLEEVAANRFPTRARRQAALIARNSPDLVGLQEVWRYRCRDLPPAPGACNSPSIRDAFIDQLPITLDALAALGARYRVAAVVRNFDTADIVLPVDGGELRGLPFAIDGKNGLVLAQDPMFFQSAQAAQLVATLAALPKHARELVLVGRPELGPDRRLAGSGHRPALPGVRRGRLCRHLAALPWGRLGIYLLPRRPTCGTCRPSCSSASTSCSPVPGPYRCATSTGSASRPPTGHRAIPAGRVCGRPITPAWQRCCGSETTTPGR